MNGFDALLAELRRVFTPGSVEAPFAWLLTAALLLLVVHLVRRWIRRAPRNEIEHVFLASAATTRTVREMSEIDSFARRASATAEDLKTRVRRLRTGHFQQVKIYIDHSNFIRTWTQIVHNRERPLEHDVDWAQAAARDHRGHGGVAEQGAQGAAGARLPRHQRLRHAVRGELFQAARDHAAHGADLARQAAAADPPAQGDGGALARGERGAQGRADPDHPERARLPDGADLAPHAARGSAVLEQLHLRRHPDRAGEDARHAHGGRPDRRRHLRRLRHRRDRVGGQRFRAGRRFRAGDAPQAGGARRLRQPHERSARQVPASHRSRQGPRLPPHAAGQACWREGANPATSPTGSPRGGRR